MKKGRPRSFDAETALDGAMTTFWTHGYDRTTLDDLVASMGINRPSLYGAFGDKSRLFIRCLQRYTDTINDANLAKLTEHAEWTQAIDAYLRSWVSVFCSPDRPGGCLLASHLGKDASLDPPIRDAIQRCASATETTLRRRLETAKHDGQLDHQISPTSLARTVLCFLAGLSAMSRLGSSKRQLLHCTGCFVCMLQTFSPRSLVDRN